MLANAFQERVQLTDDAIFHFLLGNYIMFASATSGERPNNSRFSNCSVGNISSVLDAIEEGKKKNCFTGNDRALTADETD